jgi:hypothetical protein
VDRLWSEIVEAYHGLHSASQLSNLNLSSFCDPLKPAGHFPKLKGKGCEVKSLMYVTQVVWGKLASASVEEHAMITNALLHQCEAQQLTDDHATDLFSHQTLPPNSKTM